MIVPFSDAASVPAASPVTGPRHLAFWVASCVGTSPQVCGDAEVWGDFIVPVPSAHLEGAVSHQSSCSSSCYQLYQGSCCCVAAES